MPALNVHFLPRLVEPESLAGSCCVVMDVLRATTTIIHALAHGARAVIPCSTIEEAKSLAARFSPADVVLGGERGGLPIAGFDLGNSPAEYSPARVLEKTVVLTTTNGTRALLHCGRADEVLIAGLINHGALCDELAGRARIELVCAGTDGQITREDALLAGAIVETLGTRGRWALNDQAILARDAWRVAVPSRTASDVQPRLVAALRDSLGGRNLVALGLEADLALAADIDRFHVVPRYHLEAEQPGGCGQVVACRA